jgi:hypothetical protein
VGWTYRKSLNLGPFRINISKSGIGYSVGGNGFRTGVSSRGRRYTSYTIPGTGLSYRTSRAGHGCLVAFAIPVVLASSGILMALLRGG